MEQKQTRDFFIRHMPIEVYQLLTKSASDNHRSKNQEAILALSNGLSRPAQHLQRPKPYKWDRKISNSFVVKAINEGRPSDCR